MAPLFSTRQVCVFIRKRIYQRNKGYLVLSSYLIISVLEPFIHFQSKKNIGLHILCRAREAGELYFQITMNDLFRK